MFKKYAALYLCCSLFSSALNGESKTNVKAVVFDFGGVVAKADLLPVINFLTETFGLTISELKFYLKEMQQHVSEGGKEIEYWIKLAKDKRKSLPEDWQAQFDEVIKNNLTPICGTICIVKELQKQHFITAMLSDVTEHQAKMVRQLGYYDLFDPTFLSYEINVEKPNPEAYQMLLDKLKLQANQIIFIDDKLINVEAAQKQMIDAIQFKSSSQLKKDLEDRGFDLSEINVE